MLLRKFANVFMLNICYSYQISMDLVILPKDFFFRKVLKYNIS